MTNASASTVTITDDLSVRKARALVATLPGKLDDLRKSLEQAEQRYRKAEAIVQKHEKEERRAKRTRLLAHAGGMMEMTNLLGYRFVGTSERDNPQDDLRANLLVGGLLYLAHYLSVASAEDLNALTSTGREFRKTNPSARLTPNVNPLISLSEIGPTE